MANESKPQPQAAAHNHESAPTGGRVFPSCCHRDRPRAVVTGIVAGFGIFNRMHNDRGAGDTTTQLRNPR